MIPVCTEPYEDELLYGYFGRLSLMNDFDSIYKFENTFFSTENTVFGGKANTGVMYSPSFVSGLWQICRRMREAGNTTFPDFETALSMTPYGACCSQLNEKKQAGLLESILYTQRPCVPRLNRGGKTIQVCPECMREDEKSHGEAYIRLSHNIPGAVFCERHCVRLIRCTTPDIRGTTQPLTRMCIADTEGGTNSTQEQDDTGQKMNHLVPGLVSVKCPDCGTEYPLHPYSVQTKAPCPVCMGRMTDSEILQVRIDALFPGEYKVLSPVRNLAKAQVRHIPCGSVGTLVSSILFGRHTRCYECSRIETNNLQRRLGFAPYSIIRVRDNRQSLELVHDICGRKYTAMSARFMRHPYCPYCDGRKAEQEVDISSIDPGYKLIGEYVNFRTPVMMRHTVCGTEFSTTPSSYIHRGHRCPLCTPKYSIQEALKVIEEYSDGSVQALPEKTKRGYLRLCFRDGKERIVSVREAVFDLTREVPNWFRLKDKPYVEKPGLKKIVYDEIRRYSRKTGCWTYTDGIQGHRTTQREKTAAKQLVRMKLVIKTDTGTYQTGQQTG